MKQELVNQIVNLTIQMKGALHNEDWEMFYEIAEQKANLEKQLA